MKKLLASLVLALFTLAAPIQAQETPKKKLLLITESRGFLHGVVARPTIVAKGLTLEQIPKIQQLLTRLDPHRLPERLVLEPAGHVHHDVAARQPALAGAVDVGVAALAQPDVAADVVVPAAEILGDVMVVAVRLVGDSRRRTEMDPARHRPPGRVVDDADVHPVAAALGELEIGRASCRERV